MQCIDFAPFQKAGNSLSKLIVDNTTAGNDLQKIILAVSFDAN
jgi:hypothetical protein